MSTNKFEYWPSNGQLGSTKFIMPTNIEDWPDGDALIGNFVYSEGELVDFIDIKGLIPNTSKSTTIPYDYVNIELPFAEDAMTINHGPRSKYLFIKFNDKEVEEGENVIVTLKYKGCKTVDDVKAVDSDYLTTDIVDGVWSEGLGDLEDGEDMFLVCSDLTSFTSDLSNLTNGYGMFYVCSNLTSFSADLSSLTNGRKMFDSCENLTSFNSNLSNLTEAESMFESCSNLTSFNSDLSSLIFGSTMFWYCTNLESFNSDLSSLEYGSGMFSDCSKLASFSFNLSNLTAGDSMFFNCSNLTSFNSDLSSLEYGDYMFENCKLDTASVQNIASTINTSSGYQIHIGIGNISPNEQEEAAFNTIASKGWIVYVNGSEYTPTSPAITILDENGEEATTPIPYYAKPVQTTEETANYVDANGNYYNILGGQFIYGDDLSTYGMFTCKEDAATNMGLTKLEKPQRFALKP